MAVIEKLEIDNHVFWVDKDSQLHYTHKTVEGQGSITFDREETIDLLDSLGKQLYRSESAKPIFTWPFKKKKA